MYTPTHPAKAALLVAVSCAIASTSLADDIYFTTGEPYFGDNGEIARTVGGTNQFEVIVETSYQRRPMMASVYSNQLYWSSYNPGQIWRSNLDGSAVQPVTDEGTQSSYTRAIEFHEGKMYWADEGLGAIYRASTDGTDIETVVSGYTGYSLGFWDFTIAQDRIYWTSWSSSTIKSVALDGTDFRSIQVGGGRVFSIESDGERLFTTRDEQVISIGFDGSDEQLLATATESVLSIDLFRDRVYYGWEDYSNGVTARIESQTLDGGDLRDEFNVNRQTRLWQLHVVPAPASVLPLTLLAIPRRPRRSV